MYDERWVSGALVVGRPFGRGNKQGLLVGEQAAVLLQAGPGVVDAQPLLHNPPHMVASYGQRSQLL